jgi:hypothetical protein
MQGAVYKSEAAALEDAAAARANLKLQSGGSFVPPQLRGGAVQRSQQIKDGNGDSSTPVGSG